MGLLDNFGNLNEEQTQGLLAAAAQMLQASGPSTRPTGLGQILGGGLGAYQDSTLAARKRKLEEDQAKQIGQLRGLQIQEAQGGLADHDRARQQADALRQFYMGQRTPAAGAPDAGGAVPQGMPAMPGATPSPRPTQGTQPDPYTARMIMAQQLRSAGFHEQADAQEAAALKFKPKFANEPRTVRGPDGKPMLVQMADDGTVRPIEGGYGVAEKLAFQNLGGKTVGLDPYSGATSTSYSHTMAPAESARLNLEREKFNFDRSKEAKPTFNADAGGFISPPSRANPQGLITPLAGFSKPDKPLTESQGKASLFSSRMEKSDQILTSLANKGELNSGGIKRFAEGAGRTLGLGTESFGGSLADTLGTATNWTQSDGQQQVEQAKRDFLSATLRMESGAVIGPKEIMDGDKQYFPQSGDSPAVIAQKAANRRTAIAGMALQAGPGAAKLGVGAKPPAGGWSITKVN